MIHPIVANMKQTLLIRLTYERYRRCNRLNRLRTMLYSWKVPSLLKHKDCERRYYPHQSNFSACMTLSNYWIIPFYKKDSLCYVISLCSHSVILCSHNKCIRLRTDSFLLTTKYLDKSLMYLTILITRNTVMKYKFYLKTWRMHKQFPINFQDILKNTIDVLM